MWQKRFLLTLFTQEKCIVIQFPIPRLLNIQLLGFKMDNISKTVHLIKKVHRDKTPRNGPKYLKISFLSFFGKIFGSSKNQYGRRRNPIGDFFFENSYKPSSIYILQFVKKDFCSLNQFRRSSRAKNRSLRADPPPPMQTNCDLWV